jgi:hypothetical protein
MGVQKCKTCEMYEFVIDKMYVRNVSDKYEFRKVVNSSLVVDELLQAGFIHQFQQGSAVKEIKSS